jgi:hypothetical protein
MGAWTRAHAARSAAAVAVVCAAVCAGGARAATLGISLSQCGSSSDGFQFTINGAGFTPGGSLEVDITSSEPGAFPNPNYVFPAGVTAPFINPVAVLNPDGTFSFSFASGAAQVLPATITVYGFDPVNEVTTGVVFTTTVGNSTACADGTTLAGSSGGGGGGSGGGGGLVLPTNADQCKKNGWAAYGVFKNQGDCVSYIATKGKNTPTH